MKLNLKSNYSIAIVLILILSIGILIGKYTGNTLKCDKNNYKYINSQLMCDYKPVISKKAYTGFKADLNRFIEEAKSKDKVSEVSVYFRDLDNGPTFGIREYENFSPASLLKLPVLLTYLYLSEDKPDLLDTKLIYEGLKNNENYNASDQYYQPRESIQKDGVYSIEDLLGRMIKYSDNQAYFLLNKYIHDISPNEDLLRETYLDLGINDPKSLADQTISVKTYSSIFVELYYTSFFDLDFNSDKALEILTEVDWPYGIVAGVPSDIKVAHKFGERSGLDGGYKQLHDCGIVYYPQNPYLLCIMTRGKDFNDLSQIINSISKMTYTEFNSRKL